MQKIDAEVEWIELLDYMRRDKYKMDKIIRFLSDVYDGADGWEMVADPSWFMVLTKKKIDGVWHSYMFYKNLSDDIHPIDLVFSEGYSYHENCSLSGEFGKFIMRNMDKLKPFYKKDGNEEYLCVAWDLGI